MKRSEMVKLIAEKLYIYTERGEQLASETLAWLETQGMQPPPHTFKHEVVHPDMVTTISVTNNEWEPEDETQ